MNTILRVRYHDESENAVGRLPQYIIMAQRMAWCCEGFFSEDWDRRNPKSGSRKRSGKRGSEYEDYDQYFIDVLEMEHFGRIKAYRRSFEMCQDLEMDLNANEAPGVWRPDPGVHDLTVSVDTIEEGSLIVEIGIPVAAFVATYFMNLYAKEQSKKRDYELQMRTLAAIDNQITKGRLPRDARERLLSQLISAVGKFDSEVIDEMSFEVFGQKISVSSRRVRDQIPSREDSPNTGQIEN